MATGLSSLRLLFFNFWLFSCDDADGDLCITKKYCENLKYKGRKIVFVFFVGFDDDVKNFPSFLTRNIGWIKGAVTKLMFKNQDNSARVMLHVGDL